MSTIKSSDEHLTLNADGTSKDIKFQANGVEKASIDSNGNLTVSGNLTSLGIDDNADATAMTITSAEKIGIGETVPLARLHVKNADSGVTSPDAGFDDMVVENSTDVGISLLSTDTATMAFNDANGAPDGSLQYRHDDRSMRFAIAGAERMLIDSSGNVGIGVTPEAWHSSWTALQLGATGFVGQYQGGGSDITGLGSNVYSDGTYKYLETDEAAIIRLSDGEIIFSVAASGSADAAISWTDALEVTNAGKVNIGTGTAHFSDAMLRVMQSDAYPFIELNMTGTSTMGAVKFENGNGTVGSISMYANSVSFNTSSDYRLKENVDYDWDATTRLKQLKPARFNFIADDTNTLVDGFIAHEVSSVVPEAVTGEKDAMRDEEYEVTPAVEEVRDEEGNITTEAVEAVMGTRSVPDYQGIDQSKLVPLLVKTIQELEARIAALEA